MGKERIILCVSNAYEKKYFLNESFASLPDRVKDELKIMCVLFTEEAGGILTLEYNEEGTLLCTTTAKDDDFLYDEIASGLIMKKIQREKEELFSSLEMFFKLFVIS